MAATPTIPPPPSSPSGGPRTGVEVTTGFIWIALILFLVKPAIEIDGVVSRGKWGTSYFELATGRHTVTVYFPYLLWRRAGANSITFDLASGQVRRIQYRAPWLMFLKGPIKEL